MDIPANGAVVPLFFLILGVAAVLMARYMVGAVIAGVVAYLALRIILPVGSQKMYALRQLGALAKAVWKNGTVFAELFVKDLHLVPIAALLIGGILGITFLLRRS